MKTISSSLGHFVESPEFSDWVSSITVKTFSAHNTEGVQCPFVLPSKMSLIDFKIEVEGEIKNMCRNPPRLDVPLAKIDSFLWLCALLAETHPALVFRLNAKDALRDAWKRCQLMAVKVSERTKGVETKEMEVERILSKGRNAALRIQEAAERRAKEILADAGSLAETLRASGGLADKVRADGMVCRAEMDAQTVREMAQARANAAMRDAQLKASMVEVGKAENIASGVVYKMKLFDGRRK